jgi:trimeric autotransporter adhesin
LSFVNRLRPVKYQWKPSNEIDPSLPYYNEENNRDTETVMHGLVAQEVKAALDAEGVATFAGWDVGSDTIQAISREMFISPLIKAIQELSAKCDSLQAEINTLKGQ